MTQLSPLVLVSPRPHDLIALAAENDVRAVLSLEGGPTQTLFKSAHDAWYWALEDQTGERRPWSSTDLALIVPHLRSVLTHVTGSSSAELVPYTESPFSSLRRPRSLLSTPATLRHLLGDKISVRRLAMTCGVPVPTWRARPEDRLSFTNLARALGLPFVLQHPRGSMGKGTFLVHNPEDLQRCVETAPSPRWLVSAHSGDLVVNVHVIAAGSRIQTEAPSVQLAGIAPLTNWWGGYCGNDVGAALDLPQRVRRQVASHAHTLGRAFAKMGYVGAFGADFAIHRGAVRLLEVNPRLQGSTWLLGEAQRQVGSTATAVRHVGALQGRPMLESRPPSPARLAQMVFHWTGPTTRLFPDLRPGTYRLAEGRLHFLRSTADAPQPGSGEILLTGMPTAGLTVHRDAAVLRVCSASRWVGRTSSTLSAEGARLADLLRSSINGWHHVPAAAEGGGLR